MLRFRVLFRGRCLIVTIQPGQATYRLRDGDPLEIRHHGRAVTVDHADLVLEIPPPPKVEPVRQPAGAEPRRRSRPDGD
jgi:alpha,alpha-trehalose phosphorylase